MEHSHQANEKILQVGQLKGREKHKEEREKHKEEREKHIIIDIKIIFTHFSIVNVKRCKKGIINKLK
jgi:hypothetical protein